MASKQHSFLTHNLRTLSIGALVVALVGVLGCADEEAPIEEPIAVQEAPIVQVVPEFRLDGLDGLQKELLVQDVYLGVGEIRLEPLGEQSNEVVYVTREPLFLHFDTTSDEVSIRGRELMLPHGGDFLISIRLEPLNSKKHEFRPVDGSSVRVNGIIAHEDKDKKISFNDLVATGEPTPLPMRNGPYTVAKQDEEKEGPIDWVPWTFVTSNVATVMLNDVHFEQDNDSAQKLVISFDMSRWLNDFAAPISAAVEASRDHDMSQHLPQSQQGGEPLDVSESVQDKVNHEKLEGIMEAQAL